MLLFQARVRFHNTGPSWVPGIIVMSIEDGHEGVPGLSQLDPVWVNLNLFLSCLLCWCQLSDWIIVFSPFLFQTATRILLSSLIQVQLRSNLLALHCRQELFNCIQYRYSQSCASAIRSDCSCSKYQ